MISNAECPTNYSAPSRWHKGLGKRVCSYIGCTLHTWMNTSEVGRATSSSQHTKCSCEPPVCLTYCIYLNVRKIFSLCSFLPKPHAYPKPSLIHICMLFYIKCRSTCEIRGKDELNTPLSWLPSFPSILPSPCTLAQATAGTAGSAGPHWLVGLWLCVNLLLLLFSEENNWPWAQKTLSLRVTLLLGKHSYFGLNFLVGFNKHMEICSQTSKQARINAKTWRKLLAAKNVLLQERTMTLKFYQF